MPGWPRTPPALEISTMRPSPAERIDGNKALVSSTGPKTWVANMFCHSSMSLSSTIPAAEIPAL